ncbi:MAG: PAS domain-containing protein [bacterium]|nr:PAS domain-containing protein [bacterium]
MRDDKYAPRSRRITEGPMQPECRHGRRFTSFSAGEISCRHILAEDRPIFDDALQSMGKGGSYESIEYHIKRPDGRLRCLLARAHPVPVLDDSGEMTRLVGTLQDITDRKQAEAECERARAFMLSVIDGISEGLMVVNRDYTIALANRRAREMAGEDPVAARRTCHQVSHGFASPCAGGEHSCPMEQVVATKVPVTVEHIHQDAEGRASHVEIIAAPIFDEQGEVVQVIESCRDVTERKRVEEKLAESHALLQAVIEQSPVPMAIAKPTGELTFNSACADHLQIADDPVIKPGINLFEMQQTWKDYDTEGNPVPIEDLPLARALQGKTTTGLEIRVVRKDGSEKWEIVNAAPIYNNDGELIAAFVAFPDVTERKRAAEEKLALERQVQQAQKLESLGVLAGGIAHDFNNLLMVILGNAELALDELSPMSPARLNLEEIEKASTRSAELAQQMLAYSGKGRFVIRPIGLRELVEEMAHLLEVSISKKAVLRYNFAENPPTFDGDVTQIRQVIMNLITNASEAIGDRDGVITVSTSAMDCDRAGLDDAHEALRANLDEPLPEGVYTFLEVADTGCGMDAETSEKIFDPFFTTKFTGRGVGMAAVLGIVRGHKGAVKVDSEVGKGTTFKVLFPANEPADDGLAVRSMDAAEGKDWRGTGTVLIADDEERVCAVGKEMLERMGFSVLTAPDGREALKVLREHAGEIVCVLLDLTNLTMPHLGGDEAFREMRRLDPGVAVILCSGYNEQDATQRFAGKGLAGFLQKPYRMAALKAKLMETLRDTTSGREA